jgi:hypothetical protein
MAFDLKDQNLTGVSVITQPGGVTRTKENFITVYDYLTQYKPHLIPELHYANGKGSITGMLALIGQETTYASDVVKHAEMNRLHNMLKNVTVVSETFTSPTPHYLQPNMVILISDGVKQAQAVVESITSATVFVAKNKKVGAFGFAGSVDIAADFSNTWDKGTESFVAGNTWSPKFYENYTQIIKWRYDVAESDMAHDIWLDTPDGPRWCNTDIERSNTLFDNIVELTHFFSDRIETGSAAQLAGHPQGMKCITQQIEERGNVANDYITTIADLQEIALRIVEQGTDTTEYLFLCNLEQMNKFNTLMSLVSPAAVNVGNFGAFKNDKEMMLKLDFTSVLVSGITFYFKHWKLLNDPAILATGKFDTTGVAYIGIPTGTTSVKDDSGKVSKKPYLQIMNRVQGNVNRKRKLKIFGPGGTEQVADKMSIHYLNESTNQVVGANAYFLGRKGTYYTQP